MKLLLPKMLLCLIVTGMIFSSCGPSTHITAAWTNPDATIPPDQKILVVALTTNMANKRAVEDALVEKLKANNVEASSAMSVFPPNFMGTKPSKDDILNKVRSDKFTSVLTLTLLDAQEETRYVPGNTTMYAPYPRYGYYGSFGGYYGNYYSAVYDPGYYSTTKTYFIESNLYDANSEELIWSAQSKTYDPSNISSGSRDLASALVYEMKNDNIISK
jgi:hypothetical protein